MDPVVVRILNEMEEMDYDQKSFAERLGISPVTITDWKTGKSKSYLKKITLIAMTLGTTIEYLLNGEDPYGENPKQKRAVSNSDTISDDQIKAAFFEGAGDLTKEEMDSLWADAQDYMRYKLEQRRKRQE